MNSKPFFKSLAIAGVLSSGLVLNLATQAQASSTLEIGNNADGRMEAIAIGRNNEPYFRYQTAPDGGWSDWIQTSLPDGKKAKQVETTRNVDGTMVRFAIATTGEVFFQFQPQANSPMTAWQFFHFSAEELEVGMNADGRLEVFGVEQGTKNIFHRWQTQAKTNATIQPSWANWAVFGGKASKLEVARNQDGRLELFAVNENNQLVHRFQTGPNQAFSTTWNFLGLEASDVEIGTNKDGRFEVLATRKSDGRLLNRWQTGANAPLSANWNDLGMSVTAVETAVNADGRQEFFVIEKVTGKVFRSYQAPNAGLTPWIDMQLEATEIDASLNRPSGRMEVIAIDKEGRARHRFQEIGSDSTRWNNTWHYMSNINNILLAGNPIQVSLPPLHSNPTTQNPLRGFSSPIQGNDWVITQAPGGRFSHSTGSYYAIDFGGINGASVIGRPVFAMRSGVVESIEQRYPDTGGDSSKANLVNLVIIRHENGYRSRYLHLQQNFNSGINLQIGQQINAGDLIGRAGNSGWSTASHLHIDIKNSSNVTVPFEIEGRFSF
jgi:murein DD-endopeptidase MepM/ murein hydrolase activator NlpD